jgi:hypothetical protein
MQLLPPLEGSATRQAPLGLLAIALAWSLTCASQSSRAKDLTGATRGAISSEPVVAALGALVLGLLRGLFMVSPVVVDSAGRFDRERYQCFVPGLNVNPTVVLT